VAAHAPATQQIRHELWVPESVGASSVLHQRLDRTRCFFIAWEKRRDRRKCDAKVPPHFVEGSESVCSSSAVHLPPRLIQ
jgi:hypothetical protein